jgi:hypothetical protein
MMSSLAGPGEIARQDGRRRLDRRSLAALHVLDVCPVVPVDVFACLAGANSLSAAYQLLQRLRRAGLAEMRRVGLGHVLGGRPIGLWSVSAGGREALRRGGLTHARQAGRLSILFDEPSARRGLTPRSADLPLLVATYRVLAGAVVEQGAAGPMTVLAWEFRWRRAYRSLDRSRTLSVRLPGVAVLGSWSALEEGKRATPPLLDIFVLPDLGTAPLARYRSTLERLIGWHSASQGGSSHREQVLVVATPNPEGRGTRAARWTAMFKRVAEQHGDRSLALRVLDWTGVNPAPSRPALPMRSAGPPRDRVGLGRHVLIADTILDLVGRHPCLTLRHLADLLGVSARVAARERARLIDRGWLRPVPASDIPASVLDVSDEDVRALGLCEITVAGRRILARRLGLSTAASVRHHGLIGESYGHTGRRRRLLRTLTHTLGVNSVFVMLAVAARATRALGSDEALEEWRSAAACERHHCRPDGYGSYVRDGVTSGFFLEYDRGTERAAQYARKFDAYRTYRDSGRAERDYAGFPTLLFVTTTETAKHRIAEAAWRVWRRRGTEPLPVLITTTALIEGQSRGILGWIWRTPDPPSANERLPWPPIVVARPNSWPTTPDRARSRPG